MFDPIPKSRRQLLKQAAVTGAGLAATGTLAAIPRRARAQATPFVSSDRPQLAQGIQIGDVVAGGAMIWSRADREARLIVDWATTPKFQNATRVIAPAALPTTDYSARVDLEGLPDNQHIFVRVMFENLDASRGLSEPVLGHFRAAPRASRRRDVRLVWSGDTAGQGWGIDLARGGMQLYSTMRAQEPDFFIHSGDNIYADGVLLPSVPLADGTVWNNAFLDEVPAKRKVAETLDEYRGRLPVLRSNRHRCAQPRPGGSAQGHRRQLPVHPAPGRPPGGRLARRGLSRGPSKYLAR